VEEAALLMAVATGRSVVVQVQHDALGRLGVGFYKEADQQLIDGLLPIVIFLVATRSSTLILQPVQACFCPPGVLACAPALPAEHTSSGSSRSWSWSERSS